MLYICATPIGNLKDISFRAIEVLTNADIILCEDTRTSSKLLNHYGIQAKKLVAYHEHNESTIASKVMDWLSDGLTVVQISDAGTPGISDPGSRLCKMAFEHGFIPHPIPGASAFLSLLSISGSSLPHLFLGFLSSKKIARQKELNKLKAIEYLAIIYESPHRIKECLIDICEVLGGDIILITGRELTKQFETIHRKSAGEILALVVNDKNQEKGEWVIIIEPKVNLNSSEQILDEQQLTALLLLNQELPTKKAVNLCHKLFGGNKDVMYDYLINKHLS